MKIYTYINVNLAYSNSVSIDQDQATLIPCIGKTYKGKPRSRIYVDNDRNPITGVVVCSDYIAYVFEGEQHNLYGPSIIYTDGRKPGFKYCYYGNQVDCNNQEEYEQFLKKQVFE